MVANLGHREPIRIVANHNQVQYIHQLSTYFQSWGTYGMFLSTFATSSITFSFLEQIIIINGTQKVELEAHSEFDKNHIATYNKRNN